MYGSKPTHSLVTGLRQVIAHGVIAVLALVIAFSLPAAASYILYEWWPKVESDANQLLVTEIALASVLVLLLNMARIAWENRAKVAMAKLAALVHAHDGSAGWLSRWRERGVIRQLSGVRDAFVLTLTGHDTFVDRGSLLRSVLAKAYDIRVMLVNPVGAGLRKHVDSLPPEITLLTFHSEIEASIAYLSELRKFGKKVKLKFYEDPPFWKVIVLGDHVWVQHCHSGFQARQQPEYVFALHHDEPRQGLFVPFYMIFLDLWNEAHHPEYDFETNEVIYRDGSGTESGRAPLGVPIGGKHLSSGTPAPVTRPPKSGAGDDASLPPGSPDT